MWSNRLIIILETETPDSQGCQTSSLLSISTKISIFQPDINCDKYLLELMKWISFPRTRHQHNFSSIINVTKPVWPDGPGYLSLSLASVQINISQWIGICIMRTNWPDNCELTITSVCCNKQSEGLWGTSWYFTMLGWHYFHMNEARNAYQCKSSAPSDGWWLSHFAGGGWCCWLGWRHHHHTWVTTSLRQSPAGPGCWYTVIVGTI